MHLPPAKGTRMSRITEGDAVKTAAAASPAPTGLRPGVNTSVRTLHVRAPVGDIPLLMDYTVPCVL